MNPGIGTARDRHPSLGAVTAGNFNQTVRHRTQGNDAPIASRSRMNGSLASSMVRTRRTPIASM